MKALLPGSYVRIIKTRDGRIILSAAEHTSPGRFALKHVWSGDEYALALSIASEFVDRGWKLRDDIRGATAATILSEGGRA